MYVIINKEGQVYNGSFSGGTKHIWVNTNQLHVHAILFPLKDEADDINRIIGVEGTKVIPVTELK